MLANIRGGGEFGPAWHEAGLKTHRQRIYDDFYAVARGPDRAQVHIDWDDWGSRRVERRIANGRGIHSASGNVEGGGDPGAFAGHAGYEHMSAGASWVGEYGSTKVPEERAFLASISPYNQLKPDGHYPEPLIFTTTADDRVGPVHARKFAAKMEEYPPSVLLRRDHGGWTRRGRGQPSGGADVGGTVHVPDDEVDVLRGWNLAEGVLRLPGLRIEPGAPNVLQWLSGQRFLFF